MVNVYNYQVWNTEMNTCYTCDDASYTTLINEPLRPSVKVFLYIINLFINKNMYYENKLQIKS
jgi:hypothetical protein